MQQTTRDLLPPREGTTARPHSGRTAGFSVVELVVVLALLAILAGIGAANLATDRFAVNQAATGLAQDLRSVRLEAIRRNEFVGLLVDNASNSYVVFVDMNRNLSFDSGSDPIIRTVRMSDRPVALDSLERDTLLMDSRGVAPLAFSGEWTISVASKRSSHAQQVCVTSQGRARVEGESCDR